MKVMITGAAGFIGSHVADTLTGYGHEVHGIDDLSTGARSNVPELPLVVADVRGDEAAEAVREGGYDAVVHHAAMASVPGSTRAPAEDASVNVQGTVRMLEAARRGGASAFVLASTGGALYGEPGRPPQHETHAIQPVCQYGVGKRAAEQYVEFYDRVHGLRGVSLRYGNVYGARARSGAVAQIAARLAAPGLTAYITGNGTQTRDYVHVSDVARANLLALNREASGAFNVGTGVETSTRRVFEVVASTLGVDAEPEHRDRPPGEQDRSVLGGIASRRFLGWQPWVEFEEDAEGVRSAVEWAAEHHDAVTGGA